jgi:hypothetical protein
MLRGPRFEQVSHGLYVPHGWADGLAARCRAMTRLLPPEAVFSHYTSARLRGWRLPVLPDWLPLFASLPEDGVHRHRRGLYVARTVAARDEAEVRDGVPLATACATSAQLAQDLSLLDLIAVLDSALHVGDTTPEAIEASIRPHQRGGAKLRRALAYADGRAESWWETPLRLLHVWSGIEVEPQYRVYDDWGAFIARGDLWIVGTKRLHEYDGGHHDRPETRHDDLARDKALARIEWERYGYIARNLVRGPERILRDAEDALGLLHRPQRLKRWHAEAARSTLSPAGRAALDRRLRRYWRWRRPGRQLLAQERR